MRFLSVLCRVRYPSNKLTANMAYREEPPDIPETFLGYKVAVSEKLLYEYSEEAEMYKDKIYSKKGQIEKLKQENEQCFRMLVEQLKEQERAVDQAEKVQREVVERALEDKFLYLKNSEKEVEVMEWQISEYEDQIKELEKTVSTWKYFRDKTYPENSAKIRTMKSQLKEMKQIEETEKQELEVKLRLFEEEIMQKTEILREEQKGSLLQNLDSYFDAKTLAEFRDNGWLHRELTALRSSYDKLVEEITTLEERNLELMGVLLSASESVPSEAMVPVIADTSGVLGGSSGAGRRTTLSSRKESRGSNIEQWQNRQIQLWEDESLEPLGLRELHRLRVKGTNPARCGGGSRPQTHHGIRLPSLTSAGDGEHRHEARSRKKTWPISVSMLKSIV